MMRRGPRGVWLAGDHAQAVMPGPLARVPDPEARRGGQFLDTEDFGKMPDAEYDQRPNIEMEPTRLTVRVIMSPRRAAHFWRYADITMDAK